MMIGLKREDLSIHGWELDPKVISYSVHYRNVSYIFIMFTIEM
jgi:hypothetical protein